MIKATLITREGFVKTIELSEPFPMVFIPRYYGPFVSWNPETQSYNSQPTDTTYFMKMEFHLKLIKTRKYKSKVYKTAIYEEI